MEKEDRLSVLPEDVIDLILSRLPIKDAARTTVLSSRWQFRWTRIPELIFDDLCTPTSHAQSPNKGLRQAIIPQSSNWKLNDIIAYVLFQQTGPINTFVITNKKLDAHTWNGNWITYLSRVSLKKLVLNFSPGVWCKMPCSLFCCQELVHLSLSSCYVINPPSTFGGFKHLKELELCACLLSRDGLEKLISSCPSLERMVLRSIDQQISGLHIAAPKLHHLVLIGTLNLQDVSFGANTLAKAAISFSRDITGNGQPLANPCYSNLLQFFGQLPFIARLRVEKNLLKYWSYNMLPEKLPSPCLHLTSLLLEIDFDCVKEISTVLCLLRSCPNLSRVLFSARFNGQRNGDAGDGFWQRARSPCQLQKLLFAGVIGISSTRLGLGLVETVLLNSPSLTFMLVAGSAPTTSIEGVKLLKRLLQMKRASPDSRIIHREADDPKLDAVITKAF